MLDVGSFLLLTIVLLSMFLFDLIMGYLLKVKRNKPFS